MAGNEPPICAKCGEEYLLRYGYDPSKYCDSCAHEVVAELEAKLAALDWTPITPDNLPKGPSGNYAGDEVMRMNPHTPAHVYTVERDCPDMATAQALCDTHRRPINPPQEPS